MKDLIIDCFAGGGGASVGIEMALGRQVDIAIRLFIKKQFEMAIDERRKKWEKT